MSVIALFFFALGAVCASFIGLVTGRLYTGATIVHGRSRCDVCDAELAAYQLVPIFSWVFGKGACTKCSARISPSSTITEVVLGALFLLAYLKLGLSFALIPVLVSLVLLTGIVLYDLAHAIIPPVLLVLFVLSSAATAILQGGTTDDMLLTWGTALVIGLFLALIHFASGGRAMGFSDAPLAFALALLTAPMALTGFLFSFWIGAVIGIIILVRAPLGTKLGMEVPFAPFLAAGFLLAYFTSWDIITFFSLFAA